jgi:hypothetical protein
MKAICRAKRVAVGEILIKRVLGADLQRTATGVG